MAERKMIYLGDAIDRLEARKDKTAKNHIGIFYNTVIQQDIYALEGLPPAQSERIELTTKEKEFLLDILYKNVDWTCAQTRDGIIKKLHLTSHET